MTPPSKLFLQEAEQEPEQIEIITFSSSINQPEFSRVHHQSHKRSSHKHYFTTKITTTTTMDALSMLSQSQTFFFDSLFADGGALLQYPPRSNSCVSPSADTAASASAPSSSSAKRTLQRTYKLLFAKVLLRCIEKSGNIELYQQTKKCISLCIQRNKQQDPRFTPLPQVLEVLLRELVGESYWEEAELMSRYYCRRPASIRLAAAQRRRQQVQQQVQQRLAVASAVAAQQQKERRRTKAVRELKLLQERELQQQERLLDAALQSDAVVAKLQLLTAALQY